MRMRSSAESWSASGILAKDDAERRKSIRESAAVMARWHAINVVAMKFLALCELMIST